MKKCRYRLQINTLHPVFKFLLFMKIIVLLILVPLLQVSAKGYGQEKFSLNMEQVEAAKVFMNIQKQSSYRFFYLQDDIKKLGKINIKVKDATLPEIMQMVLGSALGYRIVSNYLVVISPDHAELDKQLEVRGKVVDENGNPLEGVTVKVKGQNNGVTTEADGSFSIAVDDKTILQISIVGYEAVEMPVNGRRQLDNIVLKVAASGLNEVVVVGYATQKRASLTGAVTTVKGDDIASIPTGSLSNTLAGRIPGATIINNSGFVGASSSIQIRGIGTFNSTAPLYVIDGVVRDKAAFDVLDPNEVESLSILKDAASAAVYGARSANGVIVVKTKSGKKQKPLFAYTGTLATDRTTRPIQSYTATQELQYRRDQAATFGTPDPVTQEQLDYFKDKNYQLLDYVWKNPVSQQHDFSVNGGGDNITYYVMGGFNKADGSFKNTDYARYNFRSNVTAKINDYMRLNLNLSGNQRELDRFYWPYDDQESVTVADFYRTTFNFSRLLPFYALADGTPTTDTENGYPVAVGGWNPVELVLHGGYRKITYRSLNGIGRFDLKIPFIDGLTTSVQYNYTAGDRNAKAFILFNKSYRFARPSTANPYLLGDINLNDINIHNLSSTYESVTQAATFDKSYQLNWYLNYDKVFGKHTVSGLLVYERQKYTGNVFNGSAGDLLTTNVDQIFNASTDPTKRSFGGSESHNARASWVGRLHYEYDDRYIAEFSFRRDGSYLFPPETRWGFFPSGSAAWRISREKFFNVPFISELKFRGSIGLLGNDGNGDIAPYQFQTNYVPSGVYILGDAVRNGITAGVPPNTGITWEKSLTYNAGMDFALLNGRLTGDFDYFHRKTYDIFYKRERVIPATYGASLSNENYAEMAVKGFEVSLNYNNKIGNVRYSVGANMGYAKDKVVYIDEAAGLASWRSAIGKPKDRLMGYVSDGIIRDQKTLDALPAGFTQFGRAPQLGVILYHDLRGPDWENSAPNGKVDGFDQTYLSDNAVPRINYGITLSAQWKGLSISTLFQGVGAYDRMISTINGGGVFQTGDRPYFELWTQHWTPENPNAKYPRAGAWLEEYGPAPSSFWIRNGTYLRLRNLNISYDLPKQWISLFKMQTFRIFFNGSNLFVISGIKEMDPEQNTLDSYPIMKTYAGGVTITF
ncbi:MAG: TonB-dependent receptor [Agriterribacter sp.]